MSVSKAQLEHIIRIVTKAQGVELREDDGMMLVRSAPWDSKDGYYFYIRRGIAPWTPLFIKGKTIAMETMDSITRMVWDAVRNQTQSDVGPYINYNQWGEICP